MPQYRIPQKTQREDKIVGPLTGRQLIYGFVTLMVSYIVFAYINKIPVSPLLFSAIERALITSPFLLLGLAFTFIEFNERPFEIYFSNFLAYLVTPKVRIWQKEYIPSQITVPNKQALAQQQSDSIRTPVTPVVTGAKLASLSQLLDKPEENIANTPSAGDGSHVSSKTYDLLSTLENIETKEATDQPLQVVAKQKKGLGSIIDHVLTLPQRLLMSRKKPKQQSPHEQSSSFEQANDPNSNDKLQQILNISAPAHKDTSGNQSDIVTRIT
jgi:hypothetical protein